MAIHATAVKAFYLKQQMENSWRKRRGPLGPLMSVRDFVAIQYFSQWWTDGSSTEPSCMANRDVRWSFFKHSRLLINGTLCCYHCWRSLSTIFWITLEIWSECSWVPFGFVFFVSFFFFPGVFQIKRTHEDPLGMDPCLSVFEPVIIKMSFLDANSLFWVFCC